MKRKSAITKTKGDNGTAQHLEPLSAIISAGRKKKVLKYHSRVGQVRKAKGIDLIGFFEACRRGYLATRFM